ncbi:sporulation protein YqfD [Anaerotignum lactatifermentans]|uniref:Sporulation protein YqfD n=2 Tax=Anaerotignum lactatifermentans TaxID=160404 RepID=A0ABS2GAV9_9FIRM|nr:sporulation protein YqfD [Anaerotignum lactatifermentans]MBM6878012.1 sporulation protein YqfD [Anaerotignum lactatifermentans]
MIRVSGFSMERFLNMASYRNVYFWDVDSRGTGFTMKTSLAGLREAEYCAAKTGCTLEVLARGGLPARYRRFRKREALWAGAVCFALVLYVLSGFVWSLEIEGNERLEEESLRSACAQMGLYPGAWKNNVDMDAVTEGLLAQFHDLSWVSVGMDGTKATVRLTETIEAPEVVEKETPSDIVAAKDGLVLSISAERGVPLVKAGDVVKAGQVLISSQITGETEGETPYAAQTAAAGSVTARTWMEWSMELPLSYTQKEYTGEEKVDHILLLGDAAVDLIRPSAEENCHKEVISEGYLSLGDVRFPVGWRKVRLRYYRETEKSRTVEEAKTELESSLRQKAEDYLRGQGVLEDMNIQYEIYADCVRAVATAEMTEEIAETKEKGADAGNESSGENITAGE